MFTTEDKEWLSQQFERMMESLKTHGSHVERNKKHWQNLATGNIPQALFELGMTLGDLIERVEKLEKP